MKLIAHRGNINGRKEDFENHPDYVQYALDEGYDVEVDIWFVDGKWYLGHDESTYSIDKKFIVDNSDKMWLHCKNVESIVGLYNMRMWLGGPEGSVTSGTSPEHIEMVRKYNSIKYFWHQTDDYTLTSNGYIWVYPGKKLTKNSICVLPEYVEEEQDMSLCYGICSDFVKKYNNK
jgi:hypothetical protein